MFEFYDVAGRYLGAIEVCPRVLRTADYTYTGDLDDLFACQFACYPKVNVDVLYQACEIRLRLPGEFPVKWMIPDDPCHMDKGG